MVTKNQMNYNNLKVFLNEAIKQIKSVNLKLKALVCDQGSNNVAALKSLGVAHDNPYFITENGEKIFFFL